MATKQQQKQDHAPSTAGGELDHTHLPGDPATRIVRAGDMRAQARLKVLIYGNSGAGKSHLASLFRRPLIGLTELQGIPTIQRANPEALVFAIRDRDDLYAFGRLVKDLPSGVDAVVLDSLTDAQRILRLAHTAEQAKRQDVTDLETWGVVIDATARVARMLRDLPTHVVVICLAEEKEIMGEHVHRPGVTGKRLANDLAQYVNLVGYVHRRDMGDGKLRREVMFDGVDRYLVKGCPELDAVEPPEPLWWAHRMFGAEMPDEVRARVDAWRGTETTEK